MTEDTLIISNILNSLIVTVKENKDITYIVTDSTFIDQFKQYVKTLVDSRNLEEAEIYSRYILLLYIAILQFVVISFDPFQFLDAELVKYCDILAKELYKNYKDINMLLYTKQIGYWWKTYLKLSEIARKIPVSSQHKVTASRDTILFALKDVSSRIKKFI